MRDIEIVYDVVVDNVVYARRTAMEAIELRKRFPYAVIKVRGIKPCEKRRNPPPTTPGAA